MYYYLIIAIIEVIIHNTYYYNFIITTTTTTIIKENYTCFIIINSFHHYLQIPLAKGFPLNYSCLIHNLIAFINSNFDSLAFIVVKYDFYFKNSFLVY